jgi:hypothetical protein
MRLEGLGQLKNPTSLGIETVTFRFVASASTNYATACPRIIHVHNNILFPTREVETIKIVEK